MKQIRKSALSISGFFASSSLPSNIDPSKIVGLDCEMVGSKTGADLLARVSIVGFSGKVLLDSYVSIHPSEVKDYRTDVTGVDAEILKSGKRLNEVIEATKELLKDKLVVGHGLDNDWSALGFGHPRKMIRDTAGYRGLRAPGKEKRIPALRTLVSEILGKTIQSGSHSSVEDARSAIALYKTVMNKWESEIIAEERSIKKLIRENGTRDQRRKDFWRAKQQEVVPVEGAKEDAPISVPVAAVPVAATPKIKPETNKSHFKFKPRGKKAVKK